jgi:hypothetical protein
MRSPRIVAIAMCLGALAALVARPAAGSAVRDDTAQAPDQAPAKSETVTIVGCLIQGDPTAARAQGTTATAKADDYFVRTPAIQVPVGSTVAIGGSTDVTTSAGTPDKTTLYRVTGLDRDQLRPHVGHRIELQGHLMPDDPAAASTAKTTVDANGRATTRVENRMDVSGTLHATAVKMVSATCQ